MPQGASFSAARAMLRIFVILGIAAVCLPGCFDYQEQLRIHADGSVEAKVRYLLPPWVLQMAGGAHAFYPASATAFASTMAGAKPSFSSPGGPVDGFEGNFKAVPRLDTGFIHHEFSVTPGGKYAFRVVLAVPTDFAAAVSQAVAERSLGVPHALHAKQDRIRASALNELGYRLTVRVPGEVEDTNGIQSGGQILWKVPLRNLLGGKPVELWVHGKLSLRERVARRLGISF
jgi:hypothetical protein